MRQNLFLVPGGKRVCFCNHFAHFITGVFGDWLTLGANFYSGHLKQYGLYWYLASFFSFGSCHLVKSSFIRAPEHGGCREQLQVASQIAECIWLTLVPHALVSFGFAYTLVTVHGLDLASIQHGSQRLLLNLELFWHSRKSSGCLAALKNNIQNVWARLRLGIHWAGSFSRLPCETSPHVPKLCCLSERSETLKNTWQPENTSLVMTPG